MSGPSWTQGYKGQTISSSNFPDEHDHLFHFERVLKSGTGLNDWNCMVEANADFLPCGMSYLSCLFRSGLKRATGLIHFCISSMQKSSLSHAIVQGYLNQNLMLSDWINSKWGNWERVRCQKRQRWGWTELVILWVRGAMPGMLSLWVADMLIKECAYVSMCICIC